MVQRGLSKFFDSFLEREPLFVNKQVLQSSYSPETIPHREEQIEQVASILAPCLRLDKPSNLFIYGKPGSGKTTCINNVIKKIWENRLDIKVEGMITQEIREARARVGFAIHILKPGSSIPPVQIATLRPDRSPNWTQMGRYYVHTRNVKDTVVPALREILNEADVIVVDEVATMQLAYQDDFSQFISDLIASKKPVICTVPLQHAKRYDIISRIKEIAYRQETFREVTRHNSEKITEEIADKISRLIQPVLKMGPSEKKAK